MIYIHYTTMPEVLCDYWHEFEGEEMIVEQDNKQWSKNMIYALDELQAMSDASEISKWFKTDSMFTVYATGKQIKSPILEVVR